MKSRIRFNKEVSSKTRHQLLMINYSSSAPKKCQSNFSRSSTILQRQFIYSYNCKGYGALASSLFPLIKNPRTVNKSLNEKIRTEDEKSDCRILAYNSLFL